MRAFKKIGLVAWPERSSTLPQILERAVQWASQHTEVALLCHQALRPIAPQITLASEAELRKCHALLAIGGDGTVLSTARLALGKKIPLLGINTGRIGFLTEFRTEELESTLDLLLKDNYRTCERSMLDYEIFEGKRSLFHDTVLNEVQIEAMDPERMVDLEALLNHKLLTEYWADSLLVSTPTGSTAYNLSAGGPILHPSSHALVLNPVNPFSLSVRPLVIPADDSVIELKECHGNSVRIWADGRIGPVLEGGQRLVIRSSKWKSSFVVNEHAGFVDALREKLGWTGKPKLNQRPKPC